MDGVPAKPAAWLLTTARRRTVDRLRRDRAYAARFALLQAEADRAEPVVVTRATSRNAPTSAGGWPRSRAGAADLARFCTARPITCYGPPVPRPRTFDEDRALDAAMRTFWAHGYEATTTEDLCAATGLGRSSIYNTFSSKHELFRRSLLRYVEMMNAGQFAILEDERVSPVERLRALFAAVIDGEMDTRRDGRSIGCLTVNTTVELAGRDREAAGILERDLQRRLVVLRMVLAAGQRSGEVASRREPEDLARYVNAVIGGMRVAGQAGADRSVLQGIADTALDALTA